MSRDRGSLGAEILRLRVAADMTQQQLADAVGIQQSRIAEIESGDIKSPRLDTLMRLAKALGVSAADLVSAATAPPKPVRRGSKTKAKSIA